jgi:hypothetical protein
MNRPSAFVRMSTLLALAIGVARPVMATPSARPAASNAAEQSGPVAATPQVAPVGEGVPSAPPPHSPYGAYSPAPAPYPSYGAPPPEAQPIVVRRPRLGLLIPGAIMFGVSYILAVAINQSGCADTSLVGSCGSRSDAIYVPVIGPLVVASDSATSSGDARAYGLDSAVQAAGLVMLTIGIIGRDVVRYRTPQTTNWNIVPATLGHTRGLFLMTTF